MNQYPSRFRLAVFVGGGSPQLVLGGGQNELNALDELVIAIGAEPFCFLGAQDPVETLQAYRFQYVAASGPFPAPGGGDTELMFLPPEGTMTDAV